MRSVEFRYDVNAIIAFSADEIGILLKKSKAHYDGKCRVAGGDGGFLNGLLNCAFYREVPESEFGDYPHPFTMHQVDTMVKIMENGSTGQELDLYSKIRETLHSMIDESKRINP